MIVAMAEFRAFLRTNRLAALGCMLLVAIVLCVVAGPLAYEASPTRINILRRLAPPGADFWLGTDSLGRDVLARVLHGGRVTLVVGCGVVAIAFVAGATIGRMNFSTWSTWTIW